MRSRSLRKVSFLAMSLFLVNKAEAQEPTSGENASVESKSASANQDEAIKELSGKLAAQERALRELREELGKRLAEEQAARQASEARAEESSRTAVEKVLESAAVARSSNGLSFSGLVQVDYTNKQTSEDQLNSSTSAPLNEDRIFIRRARLRTAFEKGILAGVFEIDANTVNGSQIRPLNVEGTLRWPGEGLSPLALTVGLFKIPFGFEVGQRDSERLFVERSQFVRALFPGEYDLGARLAGGWRFVRYALAVQNGEPIGESTFPGRDPNKAKDISGRLGVEAEVGPELIAKAGFSALKGTGFHKGTSPTKPSVAWTDTNEDGQINTGEVRGIPGSSGQPSQNFDRFAIGADAQFLGNILGIGKTQAFVEAAYGQNLDRGYLVADPLGTLGRNYREFGYYLGVTQEFAERYQAGVRYDYYDPDKDSTDRQSAVVLLSSQSVSTWAFAVSTRTMVGGLRGRVIVEYDMVSDHLGRDKQGMPANLKNNLLTLRAEAAF